MEVSSRAEPSSRALTRALALAPLAAVLVAAAAIVAAQPVAGPWWINADADATYSASALNIVSGDYSRYFDHPGLPTQEALALTFGAVALAHGGPTRAWAADEMLHLDRARAVFRGWAIVFFVGGAALAFLLLGRLLGHWGWGVAGGLLWIAQPDLTDAIQIRPDVLLCALLLLAGYVIIRASERRSTALYALAAAIAGIALMTKLHAIGIVPMLLLATVIAYPGAGWRQGLRAETRAFVSRHRLGVSLAAGAWLVSFVLLNRHRFTVTTAGIDAGLLGLIAFGVFDYWLATVIVWKLVRNRVARRIFDPFYLMLAGAFALGIAIPLALVLKYSPWILSLTFQTVVGRNVNSNIKPFTLSASQFASFPLLEAMVVLALAACGALLGLVRRNAFPILWFVGAGTTTVMAMARSGELRYYAPGYVLAIPAALWLLRQWRTRPAPLLTAALVAGVLVPTFMHARDADHQAVAVEQQSRAAGALASRLLGPGEVALVPNYYFGDPDTRWWGLVHQYVYSPPAYPYRFAADDPLAIRTVTSQGDHVRYFIGSAALGITKREPLTLASGTYEAEPVPGGDAYSSIGIGAVKLLSGPGT